MPFSRDDIVESARFYKSARPGGEPVKWRHQGRSIEEGVDCAGLVVCVAWDIGYKPRDFDFTTYRRRPDGVSLREILRQHFDEKHWREAKPGDVYMMKHFTEQWPCHIGVASSNFGLPSFVHSYLPIGKMHGYVVEQTLDPTWEKNMIAAFQFRGLTDP